MNSRIGYPGIYSNVKVSLLSYIIARYHLILGIILENVCSRTLMYCPMSNGLKFLGYMYPCFKVIGFVLILPFCKLITGNRKPPLWLRARRIGIITTFCIN